MKKNLRSLGVLGAAILLVLAADVRSLDATCGGGGGGGSGGASGSGSGPAYETSWAGSVQEATSRAAEGKSGVLLYFEPEGSKEPHPFFRTKMMQELSKTHSVVRLPFVKDDAFRAELKVPKERHVIHVCDWFVNSLKGFGAGMKEKFPYPAIEDILKKLQPLVEAIIRKFEGNLKNAEKKFEKGDASDAFKALGDLVTYKGHAPLVDQTKVLVDKIEKTALAEIDEAVKIEDKKARGKELQKIRGRFKNLKSVEERCDKEIESATGMVPNGDSEYALAPSGVAEVVEGHLASVDFAKRAPSLVEKSWQAMVDGLQAERREEYEKALEFYAMAAGLDPKDSIALIYLGELYRHHLGRWQDARRTFDRVVELNNSDLAMAIALHGIGKMSIWEGRNEEGLKLFEQSLQRRPTALCYRNLAVFWNTEKEFRKAFGYATKAFELDPTDAYNQVFYAVYLILDGQKEKGEELIRKAPFDPSMSYNYACYYASQGRRELVLKYLHRHFYGYEKYDEVRGFEMAEARMDIHFVSLKEDPKFLELTSLAAK